MVRMGLRDVAVRIQPSLVGRGPLPLPSPRMYPHSHPAPAMASPGTVGFKSLLLQLYQWCRPPPVPCPSRLPQQFSDLPPAHLDTAPSTPTLVPCLNPLCTQSQRDFTQIGLLSSPTKGLQGGVQLLSQAPRGPRVQLPCMSWFWLSMGISPPDFCLLPTIASQLIDPKAVIPSSPPNHKSLKLESP